MDRSVHGRRAALVLQGSVFCQPADSMHSQPANYLSTVAVNALWCLLIALTLLALPIIARQMRLQSTQARHQAPAHTAPAHLSATGAVLLTQSDMPMGVGSR